MPVFYPICLDLSNKQCLVVGGGEVADRKVDSLVKAGALVRVISPKVTNHINSLAKEGIVTLTKRKYLTGDLDGVFLVISSTDDSKTNACIATEAHRLNILLNAVDSPTECSFIVPASVIRGDLLISISTSGKSPALSRKIRKEIQETYGQEYGTLLDVLGFCRKVILEQIPDIGIRKQVFGQLADSISAEMVKNASISDIMAVIHQAIKKDGFPFEELKTGIINIIRGTAPI